MTVLNGNGVEGDAAKAVTAADGWGYRAPRRECAQLTYPSSIVYYRPGAAAAAGDLAHIVGSPTHHAAARRDRGRRPPRVQVAVVVGAVLQGHAGGDSPEERGRSSRRHAVHHHPTTEYRDYFKQAQQRCTSRCCTRPSPSRLEVLPVVRRAGRRRACSCQGVDSRSAPTASRWPGKGSNSMYAMFKLPGPGDYWGIEETRFTDAPILRDAQRHPQAGRPHVPVLLQRQPHPDDRASSRTASPTGCRTRSRRPHQPRDDRDRPLAQAGAPTEELGHEPVERLGPLQARQVRGSGDRGGGGVGEALAPAGPRSRGCPADRPRRRARAPAGGPRRGARRDPARAAPPSASSHTGTCSSSARRCIARTWSRTDGVHLARRRGAARPPRSARSARRQRRGRPARWPRPRRRRSPAPPATTRGRAARSRPAPAPRRGRARPGRPRARPCRPATCRRATARSMPAASITSRRSRAFEYGPGGSGERPKPRMSWRSRRCDPRERAPLRVPHAAVADAGVDERRPAGPAPAVSGGASATRSAARM